MDDRVDISFSIASTIRPIRTEGQTRKIKRLATAGQEVWILGHADGATLAIAVEAGAAAERLEAGPQLGLFPAEPRATAAPCKSPVGRCRQREYSVDVIGQPLGAWLAVVESGAGELVTVTLLSSAATFKAHRTEMDKLLASLKGRPAAKPASAPRTPRPSDVVAAPLLELPRELVGLWELKTGAYDDSTTRTLSLCADGRYDYLVTRTTLDPGSFVSEPVLHLAGRWNAAARGDAFALRLEPCIHNTCVESAILYRSADGALILRMVEPSSELAHTDRPPACR